MGQKEQSKGNTQNQELAKQYRVKVEAELNKICDEILSLIDTNLVPQSTSGECKVFYYKMKGDYFRYIAEYTDGEGKSKAASNAKDAYDDATKLAEQAERYDEMAEHMKAVAQSNQELSVEERNLISVAYKNAVGSRRASWRIISSEDSYKDSTLIMQLLRDNLTLWTSDQGEGEAPRRPYDTLCVRMHTHAH